MTDFQAIVLGVVQGITEFLPISSNGHLAFVPRLLGWQDPGAPFVAVCQWGTLLATVIYFRRDILGILSRPAPEHYTEPGKSEPHPDQPDRRLLLPIAIGTLPIVVLGVLFKKQIEHDLRSLYVVAAGMIYFALLLWLAESRKTAHRHIGDVTLQDGLLVGLGQACALIPGASRSGTTITAALFAGFERSAAARFSFLLSLPAIFAAGVKELYDERHQIAAMGQTRPLIVCTVVAFIVGLASIDWLMKFLKRHPTYGFIAYRIAVGAILLALLASGSLRP